MNKVLNGLLLSLIALSLGGCASIIRGVSEEVAVNSDPKGVKVIVSNGMVGYTPTCFKLKRKHCYTLTFEKAGYETQYVHVMSEVAGAGAAGMAGNIVFGGFIGAGVDACSGAMNSLKPNPIFVVMPRAETVVSE